MMETIILVEVLVYNGNKSATILGEFERRADYQLNIGTIVSQGELLSINRELGGRTNHGIPYSYNRDEVVR